MIHRLVSPVRVDIVLNKDCNHKCMHCYNPWRSHSIEKDNNDSIDFEVKIAIIANELKKANVWSAILTGGEPLLHPDFLYCAIRMFGDLGISMSLNTNLTLLTDEIAYKLKEEYSWNNLILTSMPSIDEKLCDSITRINGSYKRIMKGLEISRKYGLRVGINTVITKRNIGDLDNYLNFLRSNPTIEYVSISIVIPPSYDVDNTDYYLEDDNIIKIADTLLTIKNTTNVEIGSVTPLPLCVLKKADKYLPVLDTTCVAGITKCTIEVETGNVFACAHEEEPYGNIYNDGLAYCWDRMGKWSELSSLLEECRRCKWLYMCGGECRMQRVGNRLVPKYSINPDAPIEFSLASIESLPQFPNNNQLLCINPNLKVRKENFGYIVRAKYIETQMSEKLFGFCELLKKRGAFTLIDLQNSISNFNDVKPVILTLLNRNIILIK